MLLYYDKPAQLEEKRMAQGRILLKKDLMQVETGEDGEALGRTWEVGTDI